MARIAFVAPPFAGHFNPMQAIAAELLHRGHHVCFAHQVDAARLLSEPKIDFLPLGADSHPPGSLNAAIARINALRGVWGLGGVMRDLVRVTGMLCRTLPQMMCTQDIDLIVADQTEPAGGLVARHLALPYVSVANALPINTDPSLPPPFTSWSYDPTPWGLSRNRGGYQVAAALMRPMNQVIAHHAAAWGLAPARSMEDCLSPTAQLSQLTAGLDFPRAAFPPGFHYIGPLRLAGQPDWTPSFDADRPFVYASLGTLQGNRPKLFAVIAQACYLAGIHCLLAHGGRLAANAASALPGAPTVLPWVPQSAVLRRAAAVITHGGMNTVLDALSCGVPVVVIPLALEQAATAARVVRAGAGLCVKAGGLVASELAAALHRVLREPQFRAAAAKLQSGIAAAGGVTLAANIIEEHLRPPM